MLCVLTVGSESAGFTRRSSSALSTTANAVSIAAIHHSRDVCLSKRMKETEIVSWISHVPALRVCVYWGIMESGCQTDSISLLSVSGHHVSSGFQGRIL